MAVYSVFLFLSALLARSWLVQGAASASTSWQQYIRDPTNEIIHPARILTDQTYGNVTNPNALLQPGGGVTTFYRAQGPTPPSWPSGTNATASSYHAPNSGDSGVPTTYNPINAVDGNLTTFWNDDTLGEYPDVLTITTPTAVTLPGITIESNADGVPVDFTVEVLENGMWTLAGTVTGNSEVRCEVPFKANVTTLSVRINVTLDQDTTAGEYTRINEVYPGIVPQDPPAPTVVVDFGRNIVGFTKVAFAGASSNHPGVEFAFSETMEYLTNISDFTRSDNGDTITPGTDQFNPPVNPYVWTDTYGCLDGTKVCADGLHGYRYLKITLNALAADAPDTEAFGHFAIDYVALNFTGFLGTPDTYKGWFECSDTELTQYWYDAAYTNDMVIDTFRVNDTDPRGAASPSLIGKLVIFDGAKRDRDPYVGDLAVSARTLYLTHSVTEAATNVLADLADHQRADGWIPPASINNYTLPLFDYPLWWVTCSYDHLVYTGDTAYATKYYPTLLRVLDDWFPSVTDTTTSLLDKGLNNTSGYGDYAFLNRTGIITYYNTLYVLALQNAASISNLLSHSTSRNTSDAARWLARATAVSNSVNAHLWDSTTGAYLDSLEGPIRHAQDGNSISVLASVASPTRSTSLLNYLDSLALPYGTPFYDNDSIGAGFSTRVYAYLSYFEVSARFLTKGLASTALDQIRRTWGWMATHDPTITFWEGIGANGSMYEEGYTSAAHGWSTGVLPALTTYVLGVTPTGIGFHTWTIKPVPAGLTWAKGVVPTPSGSLSVSWTMSSSSKFSLTFTAPKGTSGVVSVPVGKVGDHVAVDGKAEWSGKKVRGSTASYADGYVSVEVGSGTHTVVVSG